jgi:hypothetical protein
MADKAISELVAAEQITATDMFVLEQNGTPKNLTGQVLLNWLTAAADGHGGIASIQKLKTVGLADTYRITLADTTTFDFVVNNGKGISAITKKSTSGLVDTYAITYTDGTSGSYTVTNGAKGDKGDAAYIWVKYASQKPTASSSSFGDVPDDWMGIYVGTSTTAPTSYSSYKWYQIKGEKGDPGDPATLVSSTITYQVGDSGTVIPSGSWSSSVPAVTPGRYLWTRQVLQFNTGTPVTSYSVSRFGIDGSGAVSTVAGVAPDPSGNVPLTAADVKALPITGGSMSGPIKMNGQPVSGLNAPTADDQAAPKSYVDDSEQRAVKTAAPYNYLDNSDFTQFVAQAGVGGKHLEQAYAGDRWILVSGSVTGTANANGNGYTNIKLNGTIRQNVSNPPAVGTAFIEMVSGTATISYSDGEITITSNGGVIRNCCLVSGAFATDERPTYKPKGYGAELAECQRYYIVASARHASGTYSSSGNKLHAFIPTPVTMRTTPTAKILLSETIVSVTYASGSAQIHTDNAQSIAAVELYPNGVKITVNTELNPGAYTQGAFYGNFNLELSADL